MTIMCGTPPTMVSTGTVFEAYRKDCLKGNKRYSGWAEWSVPEMVKINDVSSWYISNPSMGFHLNERKIEAELGEDEIDHNIQRLGYWPSLTKKSVISEKNGQNSKLSKCQNSKASFLSVSSLVKMATTYHYQLQQEHQKIRYLLRLLTVYRSEMELNGLLIFEIG